MKASILSCLLLLLGFCLEAQQVYFSVPQKLPNSVSRYKLVGPGADGLLVYKWGDKMHLLESFDENTLKLKWAREIDMPRKSRILEIIPDRENMIFIYTVREKNVTDIYAQKFRYDLKPYDEAILIHSHKRKFGTGVQEFKVQLSQNKEFAAIYMYDDFEGITNRIDYWLINRNLIKLLDGVELLDDLTMFKQFMVSNVGDIFLLFGKSKTNLFGRTGQFQSLNLIQHERKSNDKHTESVISHEDHSMISTRAEVDNKNNRIVVAGYFSSRASELVYGYYYAASDLGTKGFETQIYDTFDPDFMKKVYERNRSKDHIGTADLRKLVLRQDGGVILVGELYFAETNVLDNGRYDGFYNMRDYSKQFSYDDIITIALYPEGDLHWHSVLKKKQYSENDQGYYSSFSLVKGRKNLHFLFNEEISFSPNIKDIILNSLGEYRVKSVINSKDYQLSFAPRYGKQISPDKLLVPGFNERNEFVLTIFQYDEM